MNVDPKDLIVDAFLDEVLGGQTPPDLTSRMMQALEADDKLSQKGNGSTQHVGIAPTVSHDREIPEPVAPPIQTPPSQRQPAQYPPFVAPAVEQKGRRSVHWSVVVVAAIVLVSTMTAGLILLQISGQPNDVVESDKRGSRQMGPVHAKDRAAASRQSDRRETPRTRPGDLESESPWMAEQPTDFNRSSPFGVADEFPASEFEPAADRHRPAPSADHEVIALINDAIKSQWEKHDVTPSNMASDEEWLRRAYVRIVGRIPTVDELSQFVENSHPDKRTKLIDALFASHEYARHWSTVWTNTLIGRSTGNDAGELVSHDGLQQFLQRSIAQEMPYDQLVFELLTATGSGKPGTSDFNGATNFLLSGIKEKSKRATGQTARVFLGRSLQCAECHDHHVGQWKQNEFWELNAFFRQLFVQRNAETGQVRLANRDFPGEGGGSIEEAEIFYPQRNGLLKVAYPVLPDGTEVDKSGLLSQINRRAVLARWIVQSDQFSRALVNRMWGHFMRFGFTRQVDDMGPHDPPSHPELLERLSSEFIAHRYDLKSLTRWIALSDPFALSSDISADDLVDAPELGNRPLFSRYYMRPMKPEEVYQSLLAATQAISTAGTPQQQALARRDWLNRLYSSKRPNGTTIDPHIGSIEATPRMPLTEAAQKVLNQHHASFLEQVANSNMSKQEKIDHLFLTALSRKPRRNELELARKLYAANQDDSTTVLETIWWALINSNEFVMDH